MIKRELFVSMQRFIANNKSRLEIYRNNMYTTGATAKAATSIFFIFMISMIHWGERILRFIAAGVSSGTRYARQQQQVNTEYEQDCFHKAKIMVYKKLYCFNCKYYHNKVAMIINYLTSSSFLYISSTTARFNLSQFCSPFGQLYFWLSNLSASA